MTNAVKARGEYVREKAADELVGRQPHDFLPSKAIGTIVLVTEGDACAVKSQ